MVGWSSLTLPTIICVMVGITQMMVDIFLMLSNCGVWWVSFWYICYFDIFCVFLSTSICASTFLLWN